MSERLGIIGASSMIATQFCEQVGDHFDLQKGDLPQVDITQRDKVEDFFKTHDFGRVILFSAITDVTQAESERDNKNGPVWQVNVEGTRNVAEIAKTYNRGLVFISTDFVFDGTSGPYSEDDPTGPDLSKVTWYGITKIEAEKLIVASLANYIILRIAYPYSGKDTGKEDLVLRLVNRYRAGKLYPMYTDQTITPTYIPDIAPALILLQENNFHGIVQLASPTPVNQHEFAKVLIKKAQIEGPNPLTAKSIEDDLGHLGAVPRPKNSALKTDKITSLGFTPTDWRQGIEKTVDLWLK